MSRLSEDVAFRESGRWAIIEFPATPPRGLIAHMERLGWRKVGRLPRWYAAAEQCSGPQAREFAAMWEEGAPCNR